MKNNPHRPALPWILAAVAALPVAQFMAPAARALEWDKTEIEQRADIGEALPQYVFTCTNTGTAAVTIAELHTSCGCLTPSLDKKTLGPGESTKLIVGFDRTGYVGETVRTMAIVTDEPERNGEPYQLVLRADLPEALTIAPRLCVWKMKERAKTKSVDVKVNLPKSIDIISATSNNGDMTVKLVVLEPGRHYRLDIKPRSTSKTDLAIITLQPAEPLPADTALTVYAQVR